MSGPVLEVENLSLSFIRGGGFGGGGTRPVVNLSLDVKRGEALAVIGASGSGKSLLAAAVLGILPANCVATGGIRYEGAALTAKRAESLRGNVIRLIPQSVSSLNPLWDVGRQLRRAAALAGIPGVDVAAAVTKMVERYGLRRDVLDLFPHQLAGGMARRILTATATLGKPRLIVADEPTTGLDAAALRDSLRHLRELADAGCAVLIITHDLSAAAEFADRVTVFHEGRSIDTFGAGALAAGCGCGPLHPYSRALWRALPGVEFLPTFAGTGS